MILHILHALVHPRRTLNDAYHSVGEKVVWLVIESSFRRIGLLPMLCLLVLSLCLLITGLVLTIEVYWPPKSKLVNDLHEFHISGIVGVSACVTGLISFLVSLLIAICRERRYEEDEGDERRESHPYHHSEDHGHHTRLSLRRTEH